MGDARDFRADWVANGPMVLGLSPADAVIRLKLFQQMFEVTAAKQIGVQESFKFSIP